MDCNQAPCNKLMIKKKKGLGGIISRLAWLGYNHGNRLLEVSGPVSQ